MTSCPRCGRERRSDIVALCQSCATSLDNKKHPKPMQLGGVRGVSNMKSLLSHKRRANVPVTLARIVKPEDAR